MMAEGNGYLRWLVRETPTTWWHDSADPDELARGLAHGATGATTNPVLASEALRSHPEKWADTLSAAPRDGSSRERVEYLLRTVVRNAARTFEPAHRQTDEREGYACAQVDPSRASDRDDMLDMARRFRDWAPNIAVKLPVTAAGLDVLEECTAEGISVTATVSFTVPQVVAVAERYRQGLKRARDAGVTPGRCFAVIMIGRLDDYLREIAADRRADVQESDIRQAGLAVTKSAYALFRERGYEAVLMVAALRGTYHMEGLAGAELVMSIHPKIQDLLLKPGVPRTPTGVETPVPEDVIDRLRSMPEFVRAYEPEGMAAEEFISFGATQRTLSQFHHQGWGDLESL